MRRYQGSMVPMLGVLVLSGCIQTDATNALFEDADGDGVLAIDDCDDGDAVLLAADADADCDGVLKIYDCDDNDRDLGDKAVDFDCDGVLAADDCDDSDASSTVVADDGDCDGVLTAADCDDGDASLRAEAYDADCDGVLTAADCDDGDPSLLAKADDVDCDGVLTADDCDDGDASSTVVADDGDCDGVLTADDCDDTDPTSTGIEPEVPYDGIDDDCDGADLIDVDRDGFAATSVGGDDCDDTDNMVHPYQWEDISDGVDNDCDGDIDTADTDSPTSLSLSDDSYDTVSFSSASIDFCGTTYTSLNISSNGLITFSSGTTSYAESPSAFASHTGAAAMWDDLRPASGGGCGTVYWYDHGDAVGVYYRDVCQYSRGPQTVTATVVFHEDGVVHMSHESSNIPDGIVGVSCGDGTTDTAYDLSDDGWTDNALGLGQGTENMVYEQWSSG
ncbi:MAG: MopE-related protein, partial [Myxococcota bacterium]|nr:MopE-related protein [Myxococcota bacterium]